MPTINIDTILSDPLLIVASVLLVVAPVVFLVALVKFLRAPKPEKKKNPFSIPHDDFVSPVASLAPEPVVQKPAPAPVSIPVEKFSPVIPDVPVAAPVSMDSEKTVVLPAGVAEIQGQLEIALTQIRTLNKKINELEPTHAKLQTLAEHVIALEKDMARLKAASTQSSGADKRPPMPL